MTLVSEMNLKTSSFRRIVYFAFEQNLALLPRIIERLNRMGFTAQTPSNYVGSLTIGEEVVNIDVMVFNLDVTSNEAIETLHDSLKKRQLSVDLIIGQYVS